MILSDFISYVRADFLDDAVEPYLWSADSLLQLANAAESEACRRADLLIDNESYSITTVAETSEYSLDAKIKDIYRMKYADNTGEVKHKTFSFLKRNYLLEEQPGKPSIYIYTATNKIMLLPVPDKEYILDMTVSRLPTSSNKSPADSFEIEEQYQLDLAYFVAGMAFDSLDVDKRNASKSVAAFVMFDRIFGAKPSAKAEVSRKRLPKGDIIEANPQEFGFL